MDGQQFAKVEVTNSRLPRHKQKYHKISVLPQEYQWLKQNHFIAVKRQPLSAFTTSYTTTEYSGTTILIAG